VEYTVLPRPSAVLTASIGSGFSAQSFYYGGFLPVKSGQRERELTHAAARPETSVFFESPHRIERTLETCAQVCPTRTVCVARELTKQFEEYRTGTAADVLAHYKAHPAKGEIVFLIRALTKEERREAKSDSPE
jgi:16S rRNA (cytidine1402-2'-O)-methyltransferase